MIHYLLQKQVYEITRTWDDKPLSGFRSRVGITLQPHGDSGDVLLSIEAPFYNDPSPPGEPGRAFMRLWNYEGKNTNKIEASEPKLAGSLQA